MVKVEEEETSFGVEAIAGTLKYVKLINSATSKDKRAKKPMRLSINKTLLA